MTAAIDDAPVIIPPGACPCECYGAPIDPVWERIPPRVMILVGYRCGTCRKVWPVRRV